MNADYCGWWYRVTLVIGLMLTSGCALMGGGGDQETLFADEFTVGQTGNWLLEGDSVAQATIRDGQLFIDVNGPNVAQFATLQEPTLGDFVVEVDATQLAGNPESSYGLLFRLQSPNAFYRFEITSSGLYIVERRDPAGAWTRLVEEWTSAPAVQTGLNAVNRLKVEAAGSNLSVYVNDQLLRQLTDATYTAGNIALDAGTFGQAGLQVAFDNLVVWKP